MYRATRYLSLLLALWSTPLRAQPAPEPRDDGSAPAPAPATRSEVVFGVTGPLDAEARATLVRLLRAELEPHGLTLVETDPSGEARDWAHHVTSGPSRLLGVLLDTKGSSGWRLVVIDAARGRAISRELPRGERDPANVEAVVSIVVSATNALREGLEVASAPLDSVVDPERSAPTPPPKTPKIPAPAAKTAPSRGTTLHGSAAALAASFAEAAEPSVGGELGVGVSIASFVDLDLGAAQHLPVTVETPFGSFDLSRTSLALSMGPVFRPGATNDERDGAFALVPSLGATVEWIRRVETHAAPGVGAGDEAGATLRTGVVLALRARYRLVESNGRERVSLVGGASASYFGERLKFLAGDEVLAEARQTAFTAELGLFFATGPL